jgi:hypothetical protein
MTVALDQVTAMHPGHPVHRMPHNNPGFDILVGAAASPVRHVEVKGTTAADPVFFMSEGERLFSHHHSSDYTLLVVVGIELSTKSHAAIRVHHGRIDSLAAKLETAHWRGRLL